MKPTWNAKLYLCQAQWDKVSQSLRLVKLTKTQSSLKLCQGLKKGSTIGSIWKPSLIEP